jgi:hypothetical protein
MSSNATITAFGVLLSITSALAVCVFDTWQENRQMNAELEKLKSSNKALVEKAYIDGWSDGSERGYYNAVIDTYFQVGMFVVGNAPHNPDKITVWERRSEFSAPVDDKPKTVKK